MVVLVVCCVLLFVSCVCVCDLFLSGKPGARYLSASALERSFVAAAKTLSFILSRCENQTGASPLQEALKVLCVPK